MRELKVLENKIGKFDELDQSSDIYLFRAAIYEGNNIVRVDGVKAEIEFFADKDHQPELDNMGEALMASYKYGAITLSNEDYIGQCLAFYKAYIESPVKYEGNLPLDGIHSAASYMLNEEITKSERMLDVIDELRIPKNHKMNELIQMSADYFVDTAKSLKKIKDEGARFNKNA
jgi:hypothetical protein